MGYKLMACDYDGTLTDSRSRVSEHTRECIQRVLDAGKFVTLCSGRTPVEENGLRRMFPAVPLILANGSILQNAATGELLMEETMDPETALRVMRWARHKGGAAMIWTPKGLYADRVNYYSRRYEKKVFRLSEKLRRPEQAAEEGIYKIMLVGLPRSIARAKERLPELCGAVNAFTSSSVGLEIVAPTVDKAFGLRKAAEYLGIAREEVIAIGDGENDIPMLRWAGLGIAMENAPDSVKAVADEIAPDCDHDGAAWAMEKYLLE